MFHRLTKIGESFAYLGLGYISWSFFRGHLDLHFSYACVLLSGLWLALTATQSRTLMRTYFDSLSRLKVRIPLTIGLVLSGLAAFTAWPNWMAPLSVVAILEIIGWLGIYIDYRRTSALYRTQGHGPLPKDAWVCPDAGALQTGDVILTSGRMADRLRDTVGHGELVVEIGGKMMCFSSYMEKGTVINPLKVVTDGNSKHGHFIVVRPTTQLTDLQKTVMAEMTTIMFNQTEQWKARAMANRQAFYKRFHVPALVQRFVDTKLRITGYDWFGLFTGRVATDHWTCIVGVLENLHRVGVKTNDYGTGLLGLGTGLLDPIMPVRFLADPAFRLLTLADQKAYQQSAVDKA